MNEIGRAARILRGGGLVAFPTETVYGLGADATQSAAVLRIFAAKGRPSTNPLIVHIADAAVARRYAAHWPREAQRLADRFWPGPLTLVLPKHPGIVREATAGLDTVGLRCPNHPLALELLREFDGPVAAPSANRSTRISPTTAEHVRAELGESVDLILDGGPCPVGIESTVLDLASGTPTILRPGFVTAAMIEAVIGLVAAFHGTVHPETPAASPGQQAVHYAPRTPAYRFSEAELPRIARGLERLAGNPAAILTVGELQIELSDLAGARPRIIPMPADPAGYARRLYAVLRECDEAQISAILVQMPPDRPEWAAIRDRLMRATRPLDWS